MPTTLVSFSFVTASSAAALSATAAAAGYTAPSCWYGYPTEFEQRLVEPLPLYALDQLRRRFLFSLTTTHDVTQSARVMLQMAYQTEIGVAIRTLVPTTVDVMTANVCERRSFIDVNNDLDTYAFLVEAGVQNAARAGFLPASYMQMFEAYIAQPYAKYRVCAVAALLCVSTAYLIKPAETPAPPAIAAPLYPFAMPSGPMVVAGSGPRI